MFTDDDTLGEIDTGVKVGLFAIRLLKKAGFQRQIAALKDYLVKDYAESLHVGVVHSMRDFAIDLTSSGNAHEEHTYLSAKSLCTAARISLAKTLELPANQLHCCLKGFSQGADGEDQVVTWARSDPDDRRPVGLDDAHPINGNTVWSALLGGNDGRTQWQPFNCFSCNDLPSATEHFQCSRAEWSGYYQSALVYPLRYFQKADRQHVTIGFLAFDSPKKDAFRKMPNIFDYKDSGEKRCEFHDCLNQSAVFHTGAAIADALSIAMRPFYEQQTSAN